MAAIRHARSAGILPRRIILQIVTILVATADLALVAVNDVQRANRLNRSVNATPGSYAQVWIPRLAVLALTLVWALADVTVFAFQKATHPVAFLSGASVLLAGNLVAMGFSISLWQQDSHDSPSKSPYSPGVAGVSEVIFDILPFFFIAYITSSAIVIYRNRFIIRLTKSTDSRGSGGNWTRLTVSSRRDSFGSRWSKYLDSPIEAPDKLDLYPPPPPPARVRLPAIRVSEAV